RQGADAGSDPPGRAARRHRLGPPVRRPARLVGRRRAGDRGGGAGRGQGASLGRRLMTRADVVVVGAGTSGATLASRLSDDPDRSVVLLEAGPDFPNEAVEPPALVVGGNLIGGAFAGVGSAVPEHDWGYYGQPLNGGRRVHLWRGRLVG